MAAATPGPAVTDSPVVAKFSDISMDDFVALVERNPDTYFKFNAAGDVVEMTPMADHANTQTMTGTRLTLWLWTGALPGYLAGSEIAFNLGDWRCRPDMALSHVRGKGHPARGAVAGGGDPQ